MKEKLSAVSDSWVPQFVDKDGEVTENESGMRLLESPFGTFTGSEFIEQFSRQRSYYSMVLIAFAGSPAEAQLQIIDGSLIERVVFKGGIPNRAIYRVGDNSETRVVWLVDVEDSLIKENDMRGAVYIDPQELKGFSADEFLPKQRVTALADLFDLENNLRRSLLAKALNANQPSYAFIFDNDVPDEYVTEFNEVLKRRKGSDTGFGISMKNAKITPLSNDDLNVGIIDLMKEVQRQIFMHVGYPTELLDIGGAALSASLYQTLVSMFYKTVVQPDIDAFTTMWNTSIDAYLELNGDTELSYENVVPIDEDRVSETVMRLVSSGVITINEGRTKLDYEPIEGGDDLPDEDPDDLTFAGDTAGN